MHTKNRLILSNSVNKVLISFMYTKHTLLIGRFVFCSTFFMIALCLRK